VLKVIDTFSMSRRLVQEFMVCACTGVGALLHEHRIPCIFRIQSEPEIPISWNLADARRPAFILRSVRQLRRAEVSLQPGRHAALGVDQYTQITSPLRRYSDLMVQRQIFHWMRSGVGLYREGDLLARMADLEDRMLKIRRAMAEADRFWILAILRDLAGSQVQAEVSEVLSSSALVFLPEFGIQTRVFPKRTLQEGEMLRLQIIRADPVEDKLVLREPAKTCESGS
jgi:exoribonuclease-2